MKKFIALLSAIILTGTSATAASLTPKTTTVLKDGALMIEKGSSGGEKSVVKSSKIDAKYCLATAFASVEKSGNLPSTPMKFTYFATPASCVSGNMGISFYGAYERIDYVGSVGGIAYYRGTPQAGEPSYTPSTGYTTIGDDVFVYSDTPLEIIIGSDTIIVYPSSKAVLSGTVIDDNPYSDRISSKCGPTGCNGSSEMQYWGFKIVDNAWSVPPGTAVLNSKNQIVGIVIGPDKGLSVMADYNLLMSGLYQMGEIEGGGKG